MAEYQTGIPHIDASTSLRRLHQICEQVAVPDFDWINQPLIAALDGLAHAAHIPAAPDEPQPHA